MSKRIFAMLLAVVLLVSLLPMPAMAAEASIEAEVQEAVSEMLKEYAQKVYQPNADDEAFSDYFTHAFFGNRKKMTLSEKSPMTAALFNSCLLQEALTEEIAAAILMAQELHRDQFYANGSTNWHNFLYSYYATGYLNKEDTGYTGSVGGLVEPNDPKGVSCHYTGDLNENDEVQTLLSGGLNISFELKQIQRDGTRVTYAVTIILNDTFDFDGSYDDIADLGYNTTKDETLKNLGWMMTFMGLDEFDWSFTTILQLEVPINCDHKTNNYCFRYSANTKKMESSEGEGFTRNECRQQKISNDGVYYRLKDSIALRHDSPWKIEYTFDKSTRLILSETNPHTSGPTYLYHSDKSYAAATRYLHNDPDDPAYSMLDSSFLDISKLFRYMEEHDYSCCMENRIDSDGNNMVYITITDETLGEIVVDGVPMNDHRIRRDLETGLENLGEKTDFLNGMDIMIRYIGTPSFPLTFDLDLKIWENGLGETSLFSPANRAPSCTAEGGTVYTCSDCGSDYLTDVVPALGHSYGDFTDDGNTTCTADGTKTRSCSVCGETETVTVEGSAAGHSFTDYTDDGNRSCTDVGTKTRRCTVCGEVETVPNEGTASGHDFGLYSFDHNSTCTADGTKTAVCKTCGEKDTVPAEGSATGHLYEAAVTAPTCTAEGYTTYTCHCGDSYVSDRTAVAEHTWDKGTVTVRPTLTAPGTIVYACTLCGKTQHMSVEQLPASAFTDVPADAYYANAVAWAVAQGITSGLSDTLFGPDVSCTRGQVVTFLWAANGKPEPESLNNTFTDVSESDYFYKAVLWAVENDITGGTSAVTFSPDAPCTRAQVATFLYAAQGRPAYTMTDNPFTDVADSAYYYDPVLWAVENGVTGGVGNGMFGPDRTCTRGQITTFLYKALTDN